MNISKKRNIENDIEKVNLKNYWLQKKKIKEQAKEHNNKLDEIARFVTKYINSRKTNDKG